MDLRGTREADKAGSWYEANPEALSRQLDGFLNDVPSSINNETLPIPGARVIIAPHAGYAYSGPCAAWAYKILDLSKAKRVFLLGPSHTYYLRGCALTKFIRYATPFGNFEIDKLVVTGLQSTGKFQSMPMYNDIEEHSLEMHLPYIYKRCTQTFESKSQYPTLIPILVGDTSENEERQFGNILAPYLEDPHNVFVVSSDFCHWGDRFSYTLYAPECDVKNLMSLTGKTKRMSNPPIHESIKFLDQLAMDAITSGEHCQLLETLKKTKNTVCGRHPIGVTMAALEVLEKDVKEPDKLRFKFVQYQRSSLVETNADSSVSYASAYAVVSERVQNLQSQTVYSHTTSSADILTKGPKARLREGGTFDSQQP
ncbi:MEMO1 family [Xylaria nigripes]|nr:MEMO1 family [Xylaria nigripes]